LVGRDLDASLRAHDMGLGCGFGDTVGLWFGRAFRCFTLLSMTDWYSEQNDLRERARVNPN